MNRPERMRWYTQEEDAVLVYDDPDPARASSVSIENTTDMAQVRAAYAPLRLRQVPGAQPSPGRDLLSA